MKHVRYYNLRELQDIAESEGFSLTEAPKEKKIFISKEEDTDDFGYFEQVSKDKYIFKLFWVG